MVIKQNGLKQLIVMKLLQTYTNQCYQCSNLQAITLHKFYIGVY